MIAEKPKLRGVIHEISFFVSLATGPLLVILAQAGTRVSATVYSFAMSALFGVSALYHRPNWKPAIRKWMRKLDHTMILVLIAGTFTPIAILVDTRLSRILLLVVWSAVLLGACLQLLPVSAPKPVSVIPYLTLGWLGLTLLPQTITRVGIAFPILLGAGGVLYTLGAIAYARRSPNPKPGVFGYHEVFHACVTAAAYCHWTGIVFALSR